MNVGVDLSNSQKLACLYKTPLSFVGKTALTLSGVHEKQYLVKPEN